MRGIVVDPNYLIQDMLKNLLVSSGFDIIMTESRLSAALDRINGHLPDFFLWSCPSLSSFTAEYDLVRAYQLRAPATKFIVLLDPASCGSAASLEISADIGRGAELHFLPKTISGKALPHLLALTLLDGPGTMTLAGLDRLSFPSASAEPQQQSAKPDGGEKLKTVSAREKQILSCLVNGLSNKVIARHLDITEGTVKVHVKSLLKKIKAENRTQAAIWARDNMFSTAVREAPVNGASYHVGNDLPV